MLDLYSRLSDNEKREFDTYSDAAKPLFWQSIIKNDFEVLIYVLGYRDLGKFHKKEIAELAKFKSLESQPVRRLWLWSRGFFKTSLITEAHSILLIINNPNIRLLVVSYSLEVAKKPLGAIRSHFTSNENFRHYFPQYCPKPNKEGKIEWGTTEAITVPNRTKHLKEPTVMCAGVGTNITGLHFDAMKIDDLVNKDSVTNDTQIQASKDYYSLLRPLFDNPTIPREDVIGTIYHFNDLHSELKGNLEFQKSFIPVHDENYNFLFPERLNKEGWENMNADPSINPYDLQRQWLLRPLNPKDAKFKEEWLKHWNELPQALSQYICVDPASTQKKKSDYTVLERWGVDWEGKHYLLEGYRDKLTSFQRIDKLFEMVEHSDNLMFVKYEVLGGRHGDIEVIKEKMRTDNVSFLIKETKSTVMSKVDRIEQRLTGRFNAGMIYLPNYFTYKTIEGKLCDFVQEYKNEYLQFPFTEHDDILDCHSQMFEEEAIRGKRPAGLPQKKKPMTADDWEKFYKVNTEMRKNNPFMTDKMIHDKQFVNRFKRIASMRS